MYAASSIPSSPPILTPHQGPLPLRKRILPYCLMGASLIALASLIISFTAFLVWNRPALAACAGVGIVFSSIVSYALYCSAQQTPHLEELKKQSSTFSQENHRLNGNVNRLEADVVRLEHNLQRQEALHEKELQKHQSLCHTVEELNTFLHSMKVQEIENQTDFKDSLTNLQSLITSLEENPALSMAQELNQVFTQFHDWLSKEVIQEQIGILSQLRKENATLSEQTIQLQAQQQALEGSITTLRGVEAQLKQATRDLTRRVASLPS